MTADPEKAKIYAKLLYDQALLIAGLPLDDPSGYTDLVCGADEVSLIRQTLPRRVLQDTPETVGRKGLFALLPIFSELL